MRVEKYIFRIVASKESRFRLLMFSKLERDEHLDTLEYLF
jgi:hypothetical protein